MMSAARLMPPRGGARSIGVAGELLLEDLVQFFQGRRLHGVQRGNAQDDVQPRTLWSKWPSTSPA